MTERIGLLRWLLLLIFVSIVILGLSLRFGGYVQVAIPTCRQERRQTVLRSPDVVCQHDRDRVELHKKQLSSKDNPLVSLHRTLMDVVHTGCNSLRRIGGQFAGTFIDCHKYVCFDDIDFENSCTVYSFGLGSDWTFEREMAMRGCIVHAFDHSVAISGENPNAMYINEIPGLHLYRVAAGKISNTDLNVLRSNPFPEVNGTLSIHLRDALMDNGDLDMNITYLKLDIEGYELHSIPDWLSSGALRNVQQLSMELHTSQNNAAQFADMVRTLYENGYVVISWDPNSIVGKDGYSGYFHFIEVVFRKTDVCVA